MSIKRNYRRTSVKEISLAALQETAILKGASGTTIGLDVAEHEIVAVLRRPEGSSLPKYQGVPEHLPSRR